MTVTAAISTLPQNTDPHSLTGISGWVVDVMESLGAPGAGLIVAGENLFPPIPSEVILPLAGFTASRGDMSLVGAIFWTTLGSLVGALALYWIGAAIGLDRIRRIADRMPLVNSSDIDKAHAWFHKHGEAAVFFGRMVPLVRSLVSIPAGVERMNLLRFSILTTLGSLIWNTIFILAGYYLGENWDAVENVSGPLQKVVVVVIVAALVWWVVRRVRERRATTTG
ncbi:DedA family protein [Dermacoccaceae bacterium W4C1]